MANDASPSGRPKRTPPKSEGLSVPMSTLDTCAPCDDEADDEAMPSSVLLNLPKPAAKSSKQSSKKDKGSSSKSSARKKRRKLMESSEESGSDGDDG